MNNTQEKPKQRSALRLRLGREYFILKRCLQWLLGQQRFAKQANQTYAWHSLFHHRSMILRPLAGVDMQLQENKRTNLALAIATLDNVVLRPGETLSIWKAVGRPTARKGYLPGLVLHNGTITQGIGGGLCQLGNLLFWIAAHSGLTITERYRHGYDVFPDVNRKVPFGAGATLAFNYIDLQIKNETVNNYQIHLWSDETYLHGELLCEHPDPNQYYIEQRNHRMQHEFWGGYSRHNEIYQIITAENGEQSERLLVENHALMMYNPFLTDDNDNDV